MVSKRPFDIIGSANSMSVAIEVKVKSIKGLQKHQDAALRLHELSGGFSCLYVGEEEMFYTLVSLEGSWIKWGDLKMFTASFKS